MEGEEGSRVPLPGDAIARAREAWPGVEVSDEAFAAYVAERAGSATADSLSIEGLYIAAACAGGDRRAIDALERAFFSELSTIVERVSSTVDVDDVLQHVRAALFVGGEGKPPKIAEYRGTGELRSWLRVLTTRAALNAATRGPKERPGVVPIDEVSGLLGVDEKETAEYAYFVAHYEAEVRAFLPEVLASLAPRERLLLKQHYLDQSTLEVMARMHRVHLATVKRQLARARERLSEGLRERMCERLGMSPSEFESMRAMIQSRLHLSMRGLFPSE